MFGGQARESDQLQIPECHNWSLPVMFLDKYHLAKGIMACEFEDSI